MSNEWLKECLKMLYKDIESLKKDIANINKRILAIEMSAVFIKNIFSNWRIFFIIAVFIMFIDHYVIIDFLNKVWGDAIKFFKGVF